MPSLHPPFFSLRGACLTMRGAAAPSALPEASRQTWLLPPSEGAPPLRPREFMRGWQPLRPLAGAPPCTRVTFSPMRKSPKNLPEGGTPSGYSPLGALSSPQQRKRCSPPRKGFRHNKRPICHFELSEQIGLVFSSGFIEGTLCFFNPWHGRFFTSEDA